MGGRVDSHRGLVRVFRRNPLVHLEEVAVALSNGLFAQPRDGILEIEVHASPLAIDLGAHT